MNAKLIDLPDFSDTRGHLVAIEGGQDIPFDIKRIYYMFGSDPNVIRGLHAHYELRQVFITMHGRCEVTLFDGTETQTFVLDNPKKGLVLDTMIWREVSTFSEDCVMVVLASEHYDEADYIRDKAQFIKEVSEKIS